MTGVDILAMEEVAIAWNFGWVWFVIVAIASFIIINLCAQPGLYGWKERLTGIGAALISSVLLGAVMGAITMTPIEYETQYKVTISDEVKMNEFLERYEIIKTEGKIYTVREK